MFKSILKGTQATIVYITLFTLMCFPPVGWFICGTYFWYRWGKREEVIANGKIQ